MEGSDETLADVVTNSTDDYWKQWMIWIVKNPWDFLYCVFLCLSPLFVISMISSWKLSKTFEAQAKEKRRNARKAATAAKGRVLRSNSNKPDKSLRLQKQLATGDN